MAAYQDIAKARIKAGVGAVRTECKKGKKRNYKEADTRSIVRKVLVELLGWNEFDDITQEQMTGKGFCDYLIKLDEKPYMIIEVKQISIKLNEEHTWQAQNYAQNEGINWVVTTNGDEWNVFNLYYVKGNGSNPMPKLFPVFKTSFIDTKNVKPNERVDSLYWLSKEAAKHDELQAYKDGLHALSPQELAKRILRKDVIDRIRIGLKNDIGLKIEND